MEHESTQKVLKSSRGWFN